jgi:hypothetical protein
MKIETTASDVKQSSKIVKTESTACDLNDFEKEAHVIETPPPLPGQPTMDATAHVEISRLVNQKYSDELVKRAIKNFNVSKLNKLKAKEFPKFLEEGKRQINELWGCNESLIAHTAMFTVAFLIAIGKILVVIEEAFDKKSEFMKWLKENFGYERLRYFQHAKQLYRMGDFARKYASLGKNRLIEFDRMKKDLKAPLDEILSSHPFDDTTADFDGALFKEHVDGIITYYRLQKLDLKYVEFDQAALIAAYLRRPINVHEANDVKKWLDNFADVDEKKKAFDFYVLNKGDIPADGTSPGRKQISLSKYIADLVVYSEEANIDDRQWIEEHKSKIPGSQIIKVFQFISKLVQNLEINLDQNQVTAEVAGEGSVK